LISLAHPTRYERVTFACSRGPVAVHNRHTNRADQGPLHIDYFTAFNLLLLPASAEWL
jgi:hypothetical protein